MTAARRVLLAALAASLLLAPTASAATLFRDDFDGPAGTPPARPWKSMAPVQCGTLAPQAASVCDPARAILDGHGHLALRVTRGGAAFLGTFDYGTGWPPSGVTWSFTAPARVTVRMRMPDLPGVWAGLWPQQVDRLSGQVDELDMAEERSSVPGIACYQHTHASPLTSVGGVPGSVSDWHTYTVQLGQDWTTYRVDGRLCLVAPAVAGRFGLLLHAVAGGPGTWQTGYGPALPLGRSAAVRVDYVKVSR